MGANTIVSTGTVADGPGLGQNSTLFYAANTGLYWCFQYRSASATTLYARYSSDLVTWNDPTNPSKTLLHTNGGHGQCLGVGYANIASTDVVHLNLYSSSGSSGVSDYNTYLRATLSGTTVTWGTEAQIDSTATGFGQQVTVGQSVAIASDGRPFYSVTADGSNGGDANVWRSANADAGTSWTPGSITNTMVYSSNAVVASNAFRALSSGGKVLFLFDNGNTYGAPTNVNFALYNAGWGSGASGLFGTNVAINPNDWGYCLRTDTDAHAVRRSDNTSTFSHQRWNGTSWSAGSTIGNHTCLANGGVAMVTDGTSVWMFIIDSAAGNGIYYNTWTSGAGWGGWTAFETSSATRKYVTASYSSATSTIAVCWSQTNGSNFDLTVEGLSTATATVWVPRPIFLRQAVHRAANF